MTKTLSPTLLGCVLLLSQALAFAQATDEHATHHADSNPAPSAAPSNPAPTMQQMQSGMKDMQELMNKISTTKDPAERQKLLDQHMQAMQTQMDMMSRMMSSPMMSGHDSGAAPGTAMNCQQMMGGDMSMMNSMMDQMKQHEAAKKCTDLHTCFQ